MDAERAGIQKVLGNIAAVKSKAGFVIGVFGGGGIGDLMRTLAFCRAVKRRYPNLVLALLFSHIGQDVDGQTLTQNILKSNNAVDVHIPYGLVQWHRAMRAFYDKFPIFFEVQHAAVRSWYWEQSTDDVQRDVDLRLRPYAAFADHFPKSNQQLEDTGETCWEIMSRTSGFDVKPERMQIECGEYPDALAGERVVAFNNGFGGQSRLKTVPLDVLGAVADVIGNAGLTPVQVGCKGEPVIPETLDLRGLTINDSAAVIQGAELYIGPEGGLVYVAKAAGTPSAVFYGPTPQSVFHMHGNTWWTANACRACWCSHPKWEFECRRTKDAAHCENMTLDGAEIGRELVTMLEHGSK